MSIGDFFTKQQLFINGVSVTTGVAPTRIEIVEIQTVPAKRRQVLPTQLQIVLEMILARRSQSVSVMSSMASEQLSAENAKNGIPPLQITGFRAVQRTQTPPPTQLNTVALPNAMTTPGPRETIHTTVNNHNTNHNTNMIVQNHTQRTEVRHGDKFPLVQVLLIVFLNIGVGVCVFSYTYYRTRRTQAPPDVIWEDTPEHRDHGLILVNV